MRTGGPHRIFVAVPIAPAIRDAAASLRARIGRSGDRLRWVATDALHLTLRFLGEITTDEVDRVDSAAQRAAASTAPFSITLAGVGAFPSLREPRVVWVGVAEGVAPLAGLARALEVELVARGFEAEARPFHPHLTVARARPGPSHDLRAAAAAALGDPAIGSQRVDGIVVVESMLGPGGPSYQEVSRAAFGE